MERQTDGAKTDITLQGKAWRTLSSLSALTSLLGQKCAETERQRAPLRGYFGAQLAMETGNRLVCQLWAEDDSCSGSSDKQTGANSWAIKRPRRSLTNETPKTGGCSHEHPWKINVQVKQFHVKYEAVGTPRPQGNIYTRCFSEEWQKFRKLG